MQRAKSIFAFLLISGLCGSLNAALAQQYGWMKVADPTDLPATSIEFADSVNGWMGVINANADRAILRTRDGGHTWQPQLAPLGIDVRSISFVTSLLGWIVGDFAHADGVILHTANGGNAWTQQLRVDQHFYVSVEAQNQQQATTVGQIDSFFTEAGLIARTTNGGQLWQEQRFLKRIDKVMFVDPLRGWGIALEGDSSRIIHTRDGGQSWTIQRYDTYEVTHLSGICFVDSLHGWAVSILSYPWLLRTTNGGKTWEKFHKFSSEVSGIFFNDICFIDSLNGWLFGGFWLPGFHPAIYRTIDGGISWFLEFVDMEVIDDFGAVDGVVLDLQHAWAISRETGRVYKYGMLTSVTESGSHPPKAVSLLQNYPNPFNATTSIPYALPSRAQVDLRVHDSLGREVGTLVNGLQGPGIYTVRFEGFGLPSGIYHYTLKVGHFVETKSMLLIK